MTTRQLFFFLALAPGLLAAQQPERYGFVALLGRDTVSVERVTRTDTHLTSDEVDRFPRVTQRRTEIDFGPGNMVKHLEMDIVLPTAVTPKWHERHFTADVIGDTARLIIRNGERTDTEYVATDGRAILPWTPQMYSIMELWFALGARQVGDSLPIRMYYVDAQAEDIARMKRNKAGGYVRALANGSAEIFRHDGLAGTGVATLDARHRMLSYSGARTTYKMEVTRLSKQPDVAAIAAGFVATEKRDGVPSELSVRDTMRSRIGSAELSVDYGRPLARGRVLVGNVMPFDSVWRTGANAATQFTTSAPITLAGLHLDAGTYTLWTIPRAGGKATLIVNRQIHQWGTQYDFTRDLGSAELNVGTTDRPVEVFTISAPATDATHGQLVLEWGSFRWTAPITVP